MTNGYYYATFEEVTIQCYDPPSGANENGTKSYIYTDAAMTNNTVEITNDNTVLKSFLGTGLNMSAASASASASGSAKTSEVATIPGLTGSGSGADGQRGDNSSSSDSGSDSSSSSTATATGSSSTGFVQGDGGSKSGADQFGGNSESLLRGSLFAVVVAVVGLCVL